MQRDMLRTTCDLLNLSACPGDGAQGVGMTDFFTNSAPSPTPSSCSAPSAPGVHVCSPTASQAIVSGGTSAKTTPVRFTASGKAATGKVHHMELWINGKKKGDFFTSQMNTTLNLGVGSYSATFVEGESNGKYIKSTPVKFSVK
jgi:hypothetical protein